MKDYYNARCDELLLLAHECYLTWQEYGGTWWLEQARGYADMAWEYLEMAR